MVRQATLNDFEFIYSLYFHPQVNSFLLYEMMDKPTFQPIYEELMSKNIKFIFEENGQPVGMFKLYAHTYRSAHIGYLGGLAIHPNFSGKGYGVKMMKEILALGKEKGFLRIELSTATTNTRAITLYEKLGFEREGILKKYTHLKSENRFLDELMMAYLF
jgi:L-phenylalanine/L-methionine N-acetyltransferase